jgi:methylase of polypeptide subunit release factors
MWLTETQIPVPKEIIESDGNLDVRTFVGFASQGTAVRWKGDYHRAKDLLVALNKHLEKKLSQRSVNDALSVVAEEAAGTRFHLHRQQQSSRARLQSRLLVYVEADLTIRLPRAPNVKQALLEALDSVPTEGFDISLRELLGVIGAHEWRKQGLFIPALEGKIHSHYGVFAPIRSEYLDLVARASLPKDCQIAFDIGTGTGVIAAILAKRGVERVIATDSEKRAISCARENIVRLGLDSRVETILTNLFPTGKADLIVCNPPWVPARPTSRLEHAVYDFESAMLRSFLKGIIGHLNANGEAWLIISNLAELLGLRKHDELSREFEVCGLEVVECLEVSPRHKKAFDQNDLFQVARSQERTRLWRLKAIAN